MTALLILVPLYVLTGVFWAGSTFTLTRTGAIGAENLFRPQMGAATLAVLTGIALWGFLHRGGFGPQEEALALGAASAILAAGVQGAGVGATLRRLAKAEGPDAARLRARIMMAERLAALLLAITIIAMTVSRYL